MELVVTLIDGEELRGAEDSKVVLRPYGVEFIAVTSDRIIPWHRISQVLRIPGSD